MYWIAGLALALAQDPSFGESHVRIDAPAVTLEADATGRIAIEFDVEPEWHIYPHDFEGLGNPTKIDAALPAGFELIGWTWPKAKIHDLYGTPTRIHEGRFTVEANVKVAPNVALGGHEVAFAISYQACANVCVDGKADVKASVTVVEKGKGPRVSGPSGADAVKPLTGTVMKAPPSHKMTVKFELSKDALAPGEEAVASIHLTIAPGYHAYAPGSPEENGPLTLAATGFDLVGAPEGPPPTRKVNDLTKETLLEYRGTLTLKQTVRAPATGIVEAPTLTLSAVVCDERTCLPPATWKARFDVKALPGPAQGSNGAGPAPKAKDSVKTDEANLTTDRLRKMSFGEFLAWSSFGGWASLFTPCVFPMIPITVSFFSKRAGGRRSRAVGLASTYALGIIATFTLIGVVVSLAFGATSLASFATNTWVNLVMGALFVVLGLSLLGLFQIAAPSSLTNKIEEAKSETKNDFVMTLLMAIAFTLASFTCTVPVLGALLGLAAQGSPMRPAAGMLAYSATFAAPFFLLALFPRVLQKLPRGGAWLEVVKISMGFVELAAALKFLSNADIGADAQILTRPLFLAVWVAIFLALALYLFGILRMPGAEGEVGAIRAVFGVGSLSLALYLFAGLFGLTYGQFVESFLPPAKYGSQGVVTNGTGAPTFHLTWVEDLDEGLRDGRAQNRRIFLNFTGDQCVNCRGMEQGMFPRPAVAAELEKMTRVEMTLDRESTPKLAERSARYREFEEKTFDTTARPFYVILEADGKTVVDTFAGSTPDEAKFLRFLRGEAVK